MTELDTIRARALTVACPYRLPDTSVPRAARRRRSSDRTGWFCGAQIGETCRDPRTGRHLGKLPYTARAAAAATALEDGEPAADDLAR